MADEEKKGKKTGILRRLLNRKTAIIIGIIVIIAIGVILLGACVYILKLKDGKEDSSDPKNAPAAVNKYANDVNISSDGQIDLSKSPKEFWEELKKSGNRITAYLDSAEELAKLMRAQFALSYLDTRSEDEIDKEINWDEINKDVDSTNIQGVVKLKRALSDNTTITMTYVSSDKFQSYIDAYNNASSDSERETAKANALKHFTLEQRQSGSDFNSSSSLSAGSNIIVDFINSWENGSLWKYLRGENIAYNSTPYITRYVTQDKKSYICESDYGYWRENQKLWIWSKSMGCIYR